LKPLKLIEKAAARTSTGPSLTFEETHVVKAIELVGERGAIGRIKIAEELDVGEGVARTLLRHLRAEGLTASSKSGVRLTKMGREVYGYIKSKVFGPVEIPKNPITVGTYNVAFLVRKAARMVKLGIEQRDAAMKLGALGATTLIFRGNKLTMPDVKEDCFRNAPGLRKMLTSKLKPKDGDIIIIGSAHIKVTSELSAKAATLETLKLL